MTSEPSSSAAIATLVRSETRTTVRRRPAVESSIHDEEEDNVTVTRARPQSSRMTTWARPLCSCVMRQTGTRKQFRDAVVNQIANRPVEARREKASQTIGRTPMRKGQTKA